MSDEPRSFIRVCAENDIPDGKSKAFTVNGKHIALYHSEGKFYATDDICSHEHEHLSEGWLEGDKIECPRHGAQFSLVTGEALTLPASKPIAVYSVKIENGDVLLCME